MKRMLTILTYVLVAYAMLLIFLFIDPEIRKAPRKLFSAVGDAGFLIANLFLLLVAVSVIDVCVNFTNFTGILTIDILNWLKSVSTFRLLVCRLHLAGSSILCSHC